MLGATDTYTGWVGRNGGGIQWGYPARPVTPISIVDLNEGTGTVNTVNAAGNVTTIYGAPTTGDAYESASDYAAAIYAEEVAQAKAQGTQTAAAATAAANYQQLLALEQSQGVTASVSGSATVSANPVSTITSSQYFWPVVILAGVFWYFFGR